MIYVLTVIALAACLNVWILFRILKLIVATAKSVGVEQFFIENRYL